MFDVGLNSTCSYLLCFKTLQCCRSLINIDSEVAAHVVASSSIRAGQGALLVLIKILQSSMIEYSLKQKAVLTSVMPKLPCGRRNMPWNIGGPILRQIRIENFCMYTTTRQKMPVNQLD